MGRRPEDLGILKVSAGGREARRKSKYGVEGRIDDDPAVSNQGFDHDMFAAPVLIQQEKAARMHAAALSKVHERVGRRSANFQELLVVKSVFRVTRGKRFWIRCTAACGTVPHPCEYRFDLLLRIVRRRDNGFRTSFQVTSRREFPAGA